MRNVARQGSKVPTVFRDCPAESTPLLQRGARVEQRLHTVQLERAVHSGYLLEPTAHARTQSSQSFVTSATDRPTKAGYRKYTQRNNTDTLKGQLRRAEWVRSLRLPDSVVWSATSQRGYARPRLRTSDGDLGLFPSP